MPITRPPQAVGGDFWASVSARMPLNARKRPLMESDDLEGLDLVASRVTDRDTVTPRCPHRLPPQDRPEQHPASVHILSVRLAAGVCAEGAPAFAIPELNDNAISAFGSMDGHDRAVRRG